MFVDCANNTSYLATARLPLALPPPGLLRSVGKIKRIGLKYARIHTLGYRIEGPREELRKTSELRNAVRKLISILAFGAELQPSCGAGCVALSSDGARIAF